MGSSLHKFLSYFQRILSVAALSLLVSACGDPEDPVVAATGNAPVPESFGVAYLKRPAEALEINANVAINFPPELDVDNNIGLTAGDVYLQDLTTGEEIEVNLTQAYTAASIDDNLSAGDVSGLEVSYDGRYLVFSMHEGTVTGLDDEDQPNTWNIWIYDADPETGGLSRVISDNDEANLGNDIDPHFLPDGRIVFASDRRERDSRSLLEIFGYGPEVRQLNESGGINFRNSSYALHVMDVNGGNLKQITFNQSNDLNPTVLENGKILFSRWDNMGGRSELNLYTVNPDGTELEVFYGAHSHNIDGGATEHYVDFKQMPDGTLIGTYARLANSRERNQLVSIDQANFVEFDIKRFTSPSLSTTGQTVAIDTPFLTNAFVSQEGSYASPFPIFESGHMDRILVAWDACRVMLTATQIPENCTSSNVLNDTGYELADPLYSVLIYELDSETSSWSAQPEEGLAIVDPVALVNRPIDQRPAILLDKQPPDELDQDMYLRNVGAISIKSVYDTQGNTAMVDTPLRPFRRNNILLDSEIDTLSGLAVGDPNLITIQMDRNTGNVVTGSAANVDPVNRSVADIATIRDPELTTADQRVARFIRISKAVPRVYQVGAANQPLIPEEFGQSGNFEMREILGYSIVEPDGSVYVEVPAEVPFTIDILDANGRSFMPHTNWMQVMPGETKVCGGCHSPNDGQAPVNTGALTPGPFPNTVSTMVAEVGETMAEARARLDCDFASCAYPKLKLDIEFDDPWTDALLAGRPPDASFAISYDATVVGPPLPSGSPVSLTCDPATWVWDGSWCRVAIDFPTHIQPILNARCISCHNDDNPAVIPPGNLVLEDQIDAANSPRLQALYAAREQDGLAASYEFLFMNRPRMEPDPVTGGRRFIVNRDPVTDEPIATVNIDGVDVIVTVSETDIDNLDFDLPERPRLVRPGVASARHSPLLYVLTGAPLVTGTEIATPAMDHSTLLTDSEKRLLMEWIDNGTQYYNDLRGALTNPLVGN